MKPQGRVIYLPPMPDSKKVREGIIEIINLVQEQELKTKAEKLDKKEVG